MLHCALKLTAPTDCYRYLEINMNSAKCYELAQDLNMTAPAGPVLRLHKEARLFTFCEDRQPEYEGNPPRPDPIGPGDGPVSDPDVTYPTH